MWSSWFESNTICVPEVDNYTSWDGLIIYAITLLIYLGFLYWLYKKYSLVKKEVLIAGLVWLGIYILLITIGARGTGIINAPVQISLVGAIAYNFILIFTRKFSQLQIPSSKKFIISGLSIFLSLSLIFTLFVYVCAFAYFLPASYPTAQRDQLRMILRIAKLEPNEENWERTKLIPLSEAHLDREGKDLIPDSIRQQSEFQGYRYLMQLNKPNQKLYTLDVLPIQYQKGMPSYHAYCIDPDELTQDTTHPYIIYCVTMADRGGKPATEQDRHFHKKNLWQMWVLGK